jgi:phosphatidylglycerophosphate synthase
VLLTKFQGVYLRRRKRLISAAIFGIAALTDLLDGYLARRRKQIRRSGS